jgi:hypothetical protein
MRQFDMETSVALDFLGELRRTHMCGALRATDVGKTVVLMGWVHKRRDHGGVIFVDLRDREGITQVVFHEDAARRAQRAELVRPEYVIAVEGKVEAARRRRGEPQSGHRRSGSRGAAHLDSQRIAHAAVSHGRRGGRQRRRAPEIPLRGSAPAAHAAQYHAALEDRLGGAPDALDARDSWKSKRRS